MLYNDEIAYKYKNKQSRATQSSDSKYLSNTLVNIRKKKETNS
jgi:hypothetical protein